MAITLFLNISFWVGGGFLEFISCFNILRFKMLPLGETRNIFIFLLDFISFISIVFRMFSPLFLGNYILSSRFFFLFVSLYYFPPLTFSFSVFFTVYVLLIFINFFLTSFPLFSSLKKSFLIFLWFDLILFDAFAFVLPFTVPFHIVLTLLTVLRFIF